MAPSLSLSLLGGEFQFAHIDDQCAAACETDDGHRDAVSVRANEADDGSLRVVVDGGADGECGGGHCLAFLQGNRSPYFFHCAGHQPVRKGFRDFS